MNAHAPSQNERWSAMDSLTASRKGSDRLRSLLYQQDLRRDNSSSGSALDLSSHTMCLPAIRRDSLNSIEGSLKSSSSISTVGTYESKERHRSCSRNSSKNKLQLSYHNTESKNSLLSLNTRWKSTPTKRRISKENANVTKFLHGSSIRPCSPLDIIDHHGRWKAMSASDSAIDRPITVIQRKASFNAIFPPSA